MQTLRLPCITRKRKKNQFLLFSIKQLLRRLISSKTHSVYKNSKKLVRARVLENSFFFFFFGNMHCGRTLLFEHCPKFFSPIKTKTTATQDFAKSDHRRTTLDAHSEEKCWIIWSRQLSLMHTHPITVVGLSLVA